MGERAAVSTRALLAGTRLSRRRLMKASSSRSADMMLQSWLVVVVFIRFAANCAAAVRELARGGAVGPVVAEFTLFHLFVVVILLSFLSGALSLGAAGLDRRRLLLSGVRPREAVTAQLLSLLSWPMTAVVALFLVPAAFVVARLPHPGAAAIGLLLSFAAALLLGALLGTAVTLHRAWRRLGAGFRLVVVAALILLVAADFDFQWTGGAVRLFAFQHPVLLADSSGAGVLAALHGWGPWTWVLDGSAWPCVLLAVVAAAAYTGGTARALARAGAIEPGRAPRRRASAGASTLYRAELRRFVASGAGAAAVVCGVGGAAWLALTPHPVAGIPLFAGFFVLVAGLSAGSNLLGPDGGAVRRYALSGTPWQRVFADKSAAWLTVTGASLVPPAAASAVVLDPGAAASVAVVFVMALAAATAWGSVASVLFAAPASGARAPREGPPFVSQAAPLALALVVVGINELVSPLGTAGFITAAAALAALSAVLWLAFLRRVARSFEDELARLLERLRD